MNGEALQETSRLRRELIQRSTSAFVSTPERRVVLGEHCGSGAVPVESDITHRRAISYIQLICFGPWHAMIRSLQKLFR